jgi:hypothetical protein
MKTSFDDFMAPTGEIRVPVGKPVLLKIRQEMYCTGVHASFPLENGCSAWYANPVLVYSYQNYCQMKQE